MALDDLSLIALSVPGETARKLLTFLKQKLPASCLSDLLCSHTYSKFYLRQGRSQEEGEELLGTNLHHHHSVDVTTKDKKQQNLSPLTAAESSLATSSSLGGGAEEQSSAASSGYSSSLSTNCSSSKKAKKEAPEDSGCGSPEMESELPSEDDSRYPEDLEERMKSEWAGGVRGQRSGLNLRPTSPIAQRSTTCDCRGKRRWWRSWPRWWTP